MLLDGVPDVAEVRAGPHLGDAEPQALEGDLAQAPGEDAAVAVTADQEHPAGVAVVAVLDHRDVQIDDVALLERLVARNAVTDLVIDRGADGLGVGLVARGAVVEGRRDAALHLYHVVMAELVQLGCRDPGLTKGVM
jgi:hypothetical protein